jgi:L-histidine N-alpha-methyltransferase
MFTDREPQPADYRAALSADVRAGLTAVPKSLPPKYAYDARGSELFDEITRQPEYYLTRAETAILAARAPEIAAAAPCESLVELGSGTSAKTRLLLRALLAGGALRQFTPLDVDPSVLVQASAALTAEYPGLAVAPFLGDFERDLAAVPRAGRRMIAFIGSTIGNFDPAARVAFLAQVRGALAPGDFFLLGTDLVKDPARLLRAYDDAAGVTADFKRNVLRVINRELNADFAVEEFEYAPAWDAEAEWVEKRLRAATAQRVTIADLDLTVDFAPGEYLHTEISAKFRPEGVRAELAAVGLETVAFWTDPAADFGLTLARAT